MTDRWALLGILQMAAAVTTLGIVVSATVAMIGGPVSIAADVVLGGQFGTSGFTPHAVRGTVRGEVPRTDDALVPTLTFVPPAARPATHEPVSEVIGVPGTAMHIQHLPGNGGESAS